MAQPPTAVSDLLPPWAGVTAHASDALAVKRVRLGMYLAFLAVALAVVLQGTLTLRLESVRSVDSELLDRAGAYRKMVQEVGRQVAELVSVLDPQVGGEPTVNPRGQALAHTLSRFQALSLEFEDLLASQDRRSGMAAVPVGVAHQHWQAARERLWYRAEVMLNLDAMSPRDEAVVQGAARSALNEVRLSAEAAEQLVRGLRQAAEQRASRLHNGLRWGMAALLVLLGVLALTVVEPAARAVRQHIARREENASAVQRLAMVAEHTKAVVMITDSEDRIEWANDAFSHLMGWPLAEVLGQKPADFMVGSDTDALATLRLRDALSRGVGLRSEMLRRTRDGRQLWLDVDLRPLHNDDGVLTGFVSVSSDITDRRHLQDQLSLSAHTDALTQLPNRAAVIQRLNKAIAHANRHAGYGFAVLFMDLDRFKQINDTLGHAAGDDLLRQVSQRLVNALRPGDALARMEPQEDTGSEVAARMGGDEFVVVLEGVNSSETVTLIAQRVLEELSEPYLVGSTPVQTGASIGVVLHLAQPGQDRPSASAQDVLRNADTAMYEAKRAGRGRWVIFDDSMHERVVRTLGIEKDLRRALKNDELFVVYQPVLNLKDRSLAGVEALVRWRHPERGLVAPVEFIGVAEESGLIDEVGAVVLRKACSQFVRWKESLDARAPAMLAVNLSRAQLKRPGLVDELRELLAECKMQATWLQLEVTESLAAQDEPIQAVLRQLKALGVKLALDDFGTGYSSLACLHQLPVDTVKVDRSFVIHAESVEYHRVLIEATIRVARTLGMTTVAEGIETEGQAQLMLALDCDRGQGYLFSRPLEAVALEAWLKAELLSHA